ncbi:MAG: hypothetical protein RL398_2885 [Planctomycetota bacterium]
MRALIRLLPLLPFAACATAPFPGPDASPLKAADVAAAIADADLVAFGEEHMTPAVHRRHHELLRELYAKRPQMVIAMEMFERDVQGVLDQYLKGEIDEATFVAGSRPWPHYDRDYRPVIEFAKLHGIPVLAANAPRDLARKASKEGVAAVLGNPNVAKESTAPKDAYWEAFKGSMAGHESMFGPNGMELFYGAQCLKDDTMAESIVLRLQQERAAGRDPIAVLICGKFHSDAELGTVARVKSRLPGLDVRVFSVESFDTGIYASPGRAGHYTLVVGDKDTIAAPDIAPAAAKAEPAKAAPTADGAKAAEAPAAEQNPEGLRPALGLMPAYGAEGPGVTVEFVRDGGSAAQAGIENGDVIVAINGKKIDDVEHYAEILDQQIIGKTIPVRVKRGDKEIEVQVKVSSRSR